MEILFLIIIGVLYFVVSSSNDEPTRDIQKEITSKPPLEDSELKRLLQKYKEFFDFLLGYPLTGEQRRAILDNSERSLVIASAGSGKTSTIIGKYAYLLKSGLAKENEVLILAFNRTVVEELKTRIKDLTAAEAEVQTFHSIGRDILKETDKPYAIDKLSEQDREGLLTTQNIELLIDLTRRKVPEIDFYILEFKALCPHHDIEEFVNSEEEYYQAIASFPYRRDQFRVGEKNRPLRIPSLDGKTWVRSQQEALIANSLFINGINFEYEKPYPNSSDAIYNPDFYYPEIDLWHEHFAINRSGESPFDGYKEEMEWKKAFHQSENNRVLYTYSYEYEEDKILDKIFNHLKSYDVKKETIDISLIKDRLEKYYIDDTYKFLRDSIKLSKTNKLSPEQVSEKYLGLKNQFRANKFKKFFIPIYESYQQHLKENGTIDFEDMLNLGQKSVNQSIFKDRYKYILVDEFQDLSFCRSELLNELLGFKGKLFGVGDDWQSIYRFTGSDISLTTEFKTKQKRLFNDLNENSESKSAFNKEEYIIQDNFRSVSDITDVSSMFIQKNPYQLRKKIRSKMKFKNFTIPNYKGPEILNPLNICSVDEYDNDSIEKVLNLLPITTQLQSIESLKEEDTLKKKEVMILGRENKDLSNIKPELLMKKRKDLDISLSTIHRSKGLECDYSIILGLDGGIRGFPKLSGEDPLLSVFLPKGELFPSSEERRVLYVAMTRAKQNVFLLNSKVLRSSFLDEVVAIAKSNNLNYKEYNFKKNRIKPCPVCKKKGKSGSLFIRKNKKKYTLFLGCEFFRINETLETDPLFCDHAENEVPCGECRLKGLDGMLSVERIITDSGPKRIVVCGRCNFERSFFKF